MIIPRYAALLAALALPALGDTTLTCAPVFRDHAVLQQQMEIPVWGKATPGTTVIVTIGDTRQQAATGNDGTWKVTLPAMDATPLESLDSAPAGLQMTITDGSQAITLNDLLIGEVWLCSGQSNMAGKVRNNRANHDTNDDLFAIKLPAVRQYRDDNGWVSAVPDDVREFSRVGVAFARELQQKLKVPVGILSASVGGTQIHTWLRPGPDDDPSAKHAPGSNYRQHIAPLVGYAMRGANWYQGEGNASDGFAYFPKLKSLIDGWRDAWGIGDFPFQVVQLAGISASDPENPAMADGRAHIREAQFQASARLKNVGLATAIDIGGPKEHPPNKTDIGIRLARWALHHTYGTSSIVPSGPIMLDYEIQCGSIVIRFDHAKGLCIAEKPDTYAAPVAKPDATLPWISIQDAKGEWHWAIASVEDTDLRVTCPGVSKPVAVRYAYTNHPTGPYLYNAAGLPAFPFTTEAWDPGKQSED